MNTQLGTSALTDQVIASDLLISAKSSVKDLAVAITEAATPEIRNTLRQHLETAIHTHENLTNYMVSKGYYQPYNMQAMLQADIDSANNTLNLVQG